MYGYVPAFVKVNEYMETGEPGVYAIGDLVPTPQLAHTASAEGLLAVCIQHEIDHLNGTVFVDHLSLLKQTRIKNKMLKQARVTA